MSENRHIDVARAEAATIVRLRDRQVLESENVSQLGSEIARLVAAEQPRQLIISFAEVRFLASAALGMLISLDRTLKASGGTLRLAAIRPELRQIFSVTMLDELLSIHDDERDALAAAQQAPAAAVKPRT